MGVQIETTLIKKLLITGAPALDPVSVYLEDFAPGKGKITVSCFGQSWTAAWGSMGENYDVTRFFVSCNPAYVIGYFAPQLRDDRFCGDALRRIARSSIIERRRGRSLDYDSLDKSEARELFDQTEDLDEAESLETCNARLLGELFGPEWWHVADTATAPNEEYLYLERIVVAVQRALLDQEKG